MPRVSAKERETRDALVMRMFIAGVPYRDIGKRVNVSAPMVHKIVKKEMRASALRRDFLGDNALDVHVERLESLYAANYAKAVSSDGPPAERLKAGELCRRILSDLGRVQGLYDGVLPATIPPARDSGDDDDEDGDSDELSAWRKKTRGG